MITGSPLPACHGDDLMTHFDDMCFDLHYHFVSHDLGRLLCFFRISIMSLSWAIQYMS